MAYVVFGLAILGVSLVVAAVVVAGLFAGVVALIGWVANELQRSELEDDDATD